MKEIRSITVRNLISEKGCDSLPSPRIDILGDENTASSSSSSKKYVMLFTGNVISNTCNPSWSTSVLRPTGTLKSLDTISKTNTTTNNNTITTTNTNTSRFIISF